jgi:3-oxoacyl-[acyl-carrier protein] reductase
LVQNVGIYHTGPLLALPTKELRHLFEINTFSTVQLMQAALPLFSSQGGSFIAVGYSGMQAITGSAHNAAYLASKTALLCLVKSLALELAPQRIRVNMVSPGILDNSVELPKDVKAFAPLGRLGNTADIAEAIAFLASDKASYITGTNLDIAGGYMVELQTLKSKDLLVKPKSKPKLKPKKMPIPSQRIAP